MNTTPQLPEIPSAWRDRYASIDTDGWRGYVERALLSEASRPFLTRPGRLFAEALVTWFKHDRNLLAEVRWPVAGGAVASEAPATVVLKEYGASGPIGRLRAMLRPPRAIGAWRQAFAILDRGFRTPRPLYLALPREGARSRSYLAVETAPPHTRLREILKQMKSKTGKLSLGGEYEIAPDAFLHILARYLRQMHDGGIWHRDFSGGNLLVPNDWRAPEAPLPNRVEPFILIDVNRARLLPAGTLSLSQRMQDLERISLPEAFRATFYDAYADGSSDLAAARELYLRSARRYRSLREARNPAVRFLRRVFTYWLRFP